MKEHIKLLSLLLSLLMVLSMAFVLPLTAMAEETSGDYKYDILDDGTAKITEYTGAGGDVVISSALDGYTVTSIGESAFSFCEELTSVTIPDSVTSIGEYAFSFCEELTSVTIPDSVTSIGNSAFSITAWYDNQPDGLVYAGKVAYNMKGTCPAEVVIKDGTKGIADSAFSDCKSLESVTIPDSVTNIGRSAFYNCKNLENVTIPDGVTSIDHSAFKSCTGLTDISVAGENTVYDSRNNCNAIIETKTDTLIAGCKNTIIPDSVTSIGEYAFYNCHGLTSVTIPGSVTTIGNSAFSGCTGLTGVTIPGTVKSIGEGAIGYYEDENWDLVKIDGFIISGYTGTVAETYANENGFTFVSLGDLPPESLYQYRLLDDGTAEIIGYSGFGGDVVILSAIDGYTVTSIGDSAFENCTGLTGVTIPDSVTSIGDSAFDYCTGLTGVTIPDSVTSIGNGAFQGCTSLANVTIGNSVTSIGNNAFFECTSLKSITIPASVTSIGVHAIGWHVFFSGFLPIEDFIIYGYSGSAAETYANDDENGITFIALGDKEEPDILTGDVNGDGDITIDDATMIQKYAAKFIELDETQKKAADTNNDGMVTIDDATMIQKYIAKMIDSF